VRGLLKQFAEGLKGLIKNAYNKNSFEKGVNPNFDYYKDYSKIFF
jgi:hypothetical protein